MIIPHSLTVLLLLFVSATLVFCDRSQSDCQENEVFVTCGACEGVCANPRPVCDPDCRGSRCECIANKGFVRSRHGHCILATECPGPSIYSEDPWKLGGRENAKVIRSLFCRLEE